MTLIKFQKDPALRNRSGFPAVNDLFNDFFDGMVTSDFRRWSSPAVNISETDDEFTMQMAAPGLKKNDFKLNVDENTLTVSAEKKSESSENSKKYNRREFSFTSFSRHFTLPETVNVDAISANYEDGIMTIRLPKREEAKPKSRQIEVS